MKLAVDGVDDDLKGAVVVRRGAVPVRQRDVSDAQIRRLYGNAPDQVKAALQPYGYYDASVDGDLQQVGKDWQVTLHVKPGEPVKVTAVTCSWTRRPRQSRRSGAPGARSSS